MAAVEFTCSGVPGTKGSVRAFYNRGLGRAIVVNDSKKAAPWAAIVSHEARLAMGDRPPLAGPLRLLITFILPRPKSHYRSTGALRADAPVYVEKKPDGDKLERCSWDALTGIVFGDDSQIADWNGKKVYAADGAHVGAQFRVEPL